MDEHQMSNQMDDLMLPLPKQCSIALVQNWQGQSEYRELSEERDEYSAKFSENQMREYAKKAVEAERERLLDILKEMHMKTNGSHNYYLHAAVHLRKQLTR